MTTDTPTRELLGQFDDRGYVILNGLFSPPMIERARAALNGLVDAHADQLVKAGAIADPLSEAPFESRLYRLFESRLDEAPRGWRSELHLAELFDFFFNPRLLDIVESILGPEIRLYPNYTVRPKLPDHPQTLVLWHQDGGYTEHWHKEEAGNVTDFRMVNVWSPFVPARAENGCMQFIAGSHKLGLMPHVQREFYLEIPPEQIEPHSGAIVDVELDPGDAVLFHNMLCHRGLPNRSKTIRWSMDWRYQDATQSTLRTEQGHLARSRRDPAGRVQSAPEWASLSFR